MPDSKAKREWDARNTVTVSLKLNRNTDADILEKLSTVESRQGYIKQLIRGDMKKGDA